MPPTLRDQDVIQRRSDVVDADVDGDTIVLSISRGQYVAFDPIGLAVWKRLERPRTLAALVEDLLQEFDVTPKSCRADVLAFLEEIREDGLIEVTPPDSP